MCIKALPATSANAVLTAILYIESNGSLTGGTFYYVFCYVLH